MLRNPDAALGEASGVAAPPRQREQQLTKTKGRLPAERERERERGGAELVGALPRELKRNAPCFPLFPRLLARVERERRVDDRKRMSSTAPTLCSSQARLSSAQPSPSVSTRKS